VALDAELQESLVERFTQAVMCKAELPSARKADVEEAPTFSAANGNIVCTCGITGSTYSERWDGSVTSAEAFAQCVAETTASLVIKAKKNHHYAWLYASR
jgi:hypothetical protein